MDLFPSRTLEELDEVDFPRLLRALEAKRIMRVETVRALQLAGKATPSPADWRAILLHDRLLEQSNDVYS